MYEETLYQKDKNGKPFVQIINEAGAVAGIKVDTGIAPLPGADDEGYTMGLDRTFAPVTDFLNIISCCSSFVLWCDKGNGVVE